MVTKKNEDTQGRSAAKAAAPAKKSPAARKGEAASRAAPAGKAVPGRKRAAREAATSLEGRLVIGKDGRLSLRVGEEDIALETIANGGGAQLVLQFGLKKSPELASGKQADLLKLLAQFLDERAMARIFGGVTTCK